MTVLRDYATALAQPTLPFGSGEAAGPRYDEVVAPDGTFRPAWKTMASAALSLTAVELKRVSGEITRFLADDGVTYVPRGGEAQPWQLDPVPLVIDVPTWARLEVGLAQRAELLNALLADIYGPQELLSSGIVPSAAIFAHAGFLRPLARPSAADAQSLLLSSTELGRDSSGEWRVLADRVQAPSGLGYAMENRRVLAQVLPELYHESVSHRMDPYFAALRSALMNSAAEDVGEPRVVVLSPGTHSETAYDQAFLASALGFPLVQGSDLTVRDGWVWIKPPGGPKAEPSERVDVILRRVDADWCDPLELRGDSRLGIAGLTEAVRRGRVRVVNGLGAGVLENPALLPYMPAICERLLGEQLRLPAVPTWWCGDPVGLDLVLRRMSEHDDGFVVRTIDGPRSALAHLSRDELRARISATPHRFVGQERLPLSQAPVWGSHESADARPLVLRTFTVRFRSAYRPLVGGLAIVREGDANQSMSKDVWVQKAAREDADQGLVEVAPLEFTPTIPALSPRALEDMFWAGRYAERAEDMLRVLLTLNSESDPLDVTADAEHGAAGVALRGILHRLSGTRSRDAEAELRSLLLDTGRRGSAAHATDRLRDALEGVRDQLSSDIWRVFSNTDRARRALRATPHAHVIAESSGRMLTAVLSLQGVTASMIRDPGWHMIEAGRYLERPLQVCTLLSALTLGRGARAEREVLEAVLSSAESSVTFRRRYRGTVRTDGVLQLLLLDRDNPRSLAFSFQQVRAHLAAMPTSTGSTRPERLLEHLETALEHVDIVALGRVEGGRRRRLEHFVIDMNAQLRRLSDSIADLHFSSGPPPQPLSSLSIIELAG
ncbi:MAG TPA: circularly permuted type 2 ATP-grasp protein [Microbacterium sp.]|uniref:circularly permuted type 2 ATP-grasp protein n=1 Tax=Microbacterium sp. TaxID=51671 RepID=UPI002C8D2943|nr:circularly permuted type 2 ATP-grasp protein [Microbacterium sp.]HWI30511.1 circularly permuted type 2 ATP-grasp protein [Microbacterium sp.]